MMGEIAPLGGGQGWGKEGFKESLGVYLFYKSLEDSKAGGTRTLMKARDPGVGSAANLSKAWEISLQNERGREENQK